MGDTLERLVCGTSMFTPTTPTCTNPASTWTNCGHWSLSRQEQSMLDRVLRLQLLTAPELDSTRFWAKVFSPSSQSLSKPDFSPAELKRRSKQLVELVS